MFNPHPAQKLTMPDHMSMGIETEHQHGRNGAGLAEYYKARTHTSKRYLQIPIEATAKFAPSPACQSGFSRMYRSSGFGLPDFPIVRPASAKSERISRLTSNLSRPNHCPEIRVRSRADQSAPMPRQIARRTLMIEPRDFKDNDQIVRFYTGRSTAKQDRPRSWR